MAAVDDFFGMFYAACLVQFMFPASWDNLLTETAEWFISRSSLMEDYSKASCCIEHDNSKGDIFEGLLSCQLLTTATGLIEVDHLSCGCGRKKEHCKCHVWHLIWHHWHFWTKLAQMSNHVNHVIYHVIYHYIIARPDVILKRWSRHLIRLGINRGFPVDPVDQDGPSQVALYSGCPMAALTLAFMSSSRETMSIDVNWTNR